MINKKNLKIKSTSIEWIYLIDILRIHGRGAHKLTEKELTSHDRMNKELAHKIEDEKVEQFLKSYSENNTMPLRLYLKMMRSAYRSLAADLDIKDRLKLISYSVAFLRIWKKVGGQFVSINAYHCVEINFHSLINYYRQCRDNEYLDFFMPQLITSQPCEHEFRRMRSLTSNESTIISVSPRGALRRFKRMEKLRHSEFKLIRNGNF